LLPSGAKLGFPIRETTGQSKQLLSDTLKERFKVYLTMMSAQSGGITANT
jgi:hypothetical protein